MSDLSSAMLCFVWHYIGQRLGRKSRLLEGNVSCQALHRKYAGETLHDYSLIWCNSHLFFWILMLGIFISISSFFTFYFIIWKGKCIEGCTELRIMDVLQRLFRIPHTDTCFLMHTGRKSSVLTCHYERAEGHYQYWKGSAGRNTRNTAEEEEKWERGGEDWIVCTSSGDRVLREGVSHA